MDVQVKIGFSQLLELVKNLPKSKQQILKGELNKTLDIKSSGSNLEDLLLTGPTATSEEIEIINQNRKSINKWRSV